MADISKSGDKYTFKTKPGGSYDLSCADLPEPTAQQMPRYRGFNLLNMFIKGRYDNVPFCEEDFQIISEWGFNFVRLPMDYRLWIVDGDWTKFDENQFENIDRAIEYGRKYNLHINLNFHRAPGFTVARPPEPTSLWTDEETQRICAMHWAYFAKRYKGIPNKNLSFNLVNEPANVSSADYAKAATLCIEAIRAEDPQRLIVSDGLDYGQYPCMELVPLNIVQSTRGYQPIELTHYQAEWVKGSDAWAVPVWPPDPAANVLKDRKWLWDVYLKPWVELKERNVGVMVGEWGAHNRTPHDVTLRWMEDCLKDYQRADIGWALWNLTGSFGVLDSERQDVQYEEFRGHKLDREMLDLLKRY